VSAGQSISGKIMTRSPKSRNYSVTNAREADCGIAIIGGGFSGSALAIQILRHSRGGESLTILDPALSLGRGVAYSTQCRNHLLNVPAGKMSALPDDPDHFVQWLRKRFDSSAAPDQFLPRNVFGSYLEDLLWQSVREHPNVSFNWLRNAVVSIALKGEQVQLTLESGSVLRAKLAVIATGNNPPPDPPQMSFAAPEMYQRNPWAANGGAEVSGLKSVFLLGSGLTAVDQVVALVEAGYENDFVMLSRHGLLPSVHLSNSCWPDAWTADLPNTIRLLLRAVRRQIRIAEAAGSDWRGVLDSMRPQTQNIWRTLPLLEKKRFLRHVRPYWESHRHRMPPEVHRVLTYLISRNKLKVFAGRLVAYGEADGRAMVTFQERSTGRLLTLPSDRIFNCTGPHPQNGSQEGVIRSLIEAGLGRADELNLGLAVSADACILNHFDKPSDAIYAIGPAQKGLLWETTAVVEIRCQAIRLAKHLLLQLAKRVVEPLVDHGVRF
jgi:uncharacterized NAD(P)/FAD-binding protein YdhS